MYNIRDYRESESILEALDFKEKGFMIIAGGTDVLIKIREHKSGYEDKSLVGISRITELKGIKKDEKGNIHIGPCSSFCEIEEHPIIIENLVALKMGVASIGGPQIRNVGTIGGNICNGAISADSVPSLFIYEARLILQSKKGKREISILDFYHGPGVVELRDDEILVDIIVSRENYEGFKGHYIKVSQRRAMDIANLNCGVLIKMSGPRVEDLRIAFGVASKTPVRARTGESFAIGKELTPDLMTEVGKLCLEDTNPRDSWRASKVFRVELIKELPKRGVLNALGGGCHE